MHPTNPSRTARAAALAVLAAALACAQSAPTLTSLSPSSVPANAAATITLNGTNLAAGTDVLTGPDPYPNVLSNALCFCFTYTSTAQITVQFPKDLLTTPGPLMVRVRNSAGTSNALTLTVGSGGPSANNPVPSITSLSPSSATAGGPAFTLTVNGSNFVSGSVVQWNGLSRTTTFVSAAQLTAAISAGDITDAGTAAVTVFNPAPGGGTSGSATFTINTGLPPQQTTFKPTIIWMLPLTTTAGGPATTLSVYGANFIQGSTVQWNGANRPTTFVNSNQLKVAITAADIATPGSASVTVANPGTNGGSLIEWVYPVISPGVTAFAAGPTPVADAPVAAAVDTALHRIYVVHRGIFRDICINGGDCAHWPSDAVSVVDEATGNVLTTIAAGSSVNGEGQAIAVDSTRHHVFVTNAGDNSVTVIDGATNTTIATTTVDKNPEGIAVDPDRGIVYVAAANVTLLDAGTGALLASIPVGGAAWAVAVDRTSHLGYALVNSAPAVVAAVDGGAQTVRSRTTLPGSLQTYLGIAVDPGSRVYACNYNNASIAAIDITGATPTVIGSFSGATQYAEAVAVDPGSHLVYVVSSGDAVVNVFDSSGVKQKSIALLRLPTAIAIDQTSGRAYAVNTESDSLSVVDTGQLALTGTIPLGVQPMGLAFDSSTGRLYAANLLADSVSVIDPASHNFTSWPSGGAPWSVAVDPGLKQLYAVNTADGSVSVFSTLDGSLKTRLSAGATGNPGAPEVAVNLTTNMVYVSDGKLGGKVTVINGKTNQVVTQIPAGDAPVGIAIDETANRVYVANQQSATISVIDGAANQVIATWQGVGNVWRLAVDPALKHLYASIPPLNVLSFTGLEVLDTSTGSVLAQVAANSSAAEDVAVNPKTHHVFLADFRSGTATAIDGATNAVLALFVTGTTAHSLTVDANAGLVYVSNLYDATIGVFADPTGPPPPVVNSGGVVSAASGTAGLSAGGIVTIYGTNLAAGTAVASGVPWPTTLANVQVLVNGIAAPIYFVSPGQVAFQMPWETLGQSQVSVVVVLNGVSSAPQTVKLAAGGPDLFSMNQQGTGQGAIQIANTTLLAAPPGSVPGFQSRPAQRGVDYLTIYCTGLGDVSPRPASGAPAPAGPLAQTVATPAVTIGGVAAPTPIFSGLSPGFVGLYQINVQVPADAPAGDAVPVVVTIGGPRSNTVTIALQ